MLKIIAIILLLCLLIKILDYPYSKSKITLNLHLGKGVPIIIPTLFKFNESNKIEKNISNNYQKENNNLESKKIKDKIIIFILFICCFILGIIGLIFNI